MIYIYVYIHIVYDIEYMIHSIWYMVHGGSKSPGLLSRTCFKFPYGGYILNHMVSELW